MSDQPEVTLTKEPLRRIDNSRGAPETYMMTGECMNCRDGLFVIVHRRGASAHPADCPTCGCHSRVYSKRLATYGEAGVGV